jgi:Ca2+-dependent lipid-binding protein
LKQFQTSGEKRDPIIMSFDLVIDVLAGRDLPKMDNVGQTDPYVVLTIGNQKKKKKTKTIKNTANPMWYQQIAFKAKEVTSSVLIAALRDDDVIFDDDISSTKIQIDSIKAEETIDKWFPMTPASGADKGGEIHLKILARGVSSSSCSCCSIF